MSTKIKILFLEHDFTDIELIKYELQQSGILYHSELSDDKINYTEQLKKFRPDIILADYKLPSFSGSEAFEIKQALCPETPFIIISGTIGEEIATGLIKSGVTDYVLKDKLFTLSNKIARALHEANEKAIRFKTEQEYRESERRLVEAQAMSKIGSWETSLLDLKVIWSAETYKIFGLEPGTIEITHSKYIDLVHPSDREMVNNAFTESLQNTKLNCIEHRLVTQLGQVKIVEECWRIVYDSNNIATKAIGTCQDITEKKENERQRIFDENNFKALLNNTKDSMWSIDRELNLVSFNKAFARIISSLFKMDITKGSSILSMGFPQEQLEHFTKYFNRAFAGESFTTIEYVNFPSEKWGEISYTPIYEDNKVIGTACHSRDITDLKMSEEELRKSAMFNRGVLDALNSHIAVVDAKGEILTVNNAWNNFSFENGVSDLSCITVGANYFEVCQRSALAGDTVAAEVFEGMKNVLEEHQNSFTLEYRCHSPVAKRWFSMNVIKFDSTTPMLVIAHHNITQRKLAEENLLKSESMLKEAQSIAQISNWEIDMVSNTFNWSDEVYKILGIAKNESPASAELFFSFLHPDDISEVRDTIQKSMVTGESSTSQFRFLRGDGAMRYGHIKRNAILNEHKKPQRLVGTFQDVTTQKLAELEREKMISDILLRSKNLEQFAYIISHNLRAPVANILGISNLLKDDISAADKIRTQEYLFSSVERLDNVIKDLVLILQTRSAITETKEPVNFTELVNLIEDSVQNLIVKEGVIILTDFSAIVTLHSLKSYLYSIFYNLILNSIKYKEPGRNCVIQIKTAIEDDKVMISFKDNGSGIDLKKHGDKLFGLYNRFHPQVEGKGLGLFMVKTQVEVLSGSIDVKSIIGEGTEFIIKLPVN